MNQRVTAAFSLFLAALPVTVPAAPQERTTTVSDRQLLNLTIYNGGTALVHDRRRIPIAAGTNRLAWRDVSADMEPTSALLERVGSGPNFTVLEQNFNFDLLDPSALLQKYVGHIVTVVHDARFAGERDTSESARILSINDGIVLQYGDRIETAVRGHIVYPASPRNFRDRPTLDIDLQSAGEGLQTVDLSYLTRGLDWHVDYVGLLAPDEAHIALNGLVTLSNTSGTSYDNARLQLVAGNVQMNLGEERSIKMIARVTSSYAANGVRQENYFEYHLYTMPRPATILDKQTKQLSLLSARDVPVRKTLELRGSPQYYRSAEPDIGDRLPIGVYVTFENRGGDLGVPLPGGVVRIYHADSRGLTQFLGEDQIVHTPKNESVRLHLGDSFDVTARKRQTDYRQDNCATDSSYEITIANAKDIDQTVQVIEPIPGDWQILNENLPHVKTSASTATWSIFVPHDGRATLTYTARVKWCF